MTFVRKHKILFEGGIVFALYLAISFLIITSQEPLTAQSSQAWNVQTLKEYFDQRFNDLEVAIIKQENAYNDRFNNTNEWRGSYEDLLKKLQELIQTMQRDYIPRTEYAGLEKQLSEIKARLEKHDNLEAGGANKVGWLVGGFGLVIAAIALGRNLIAFLFNKPKV